MIVLVLELLELVVVNLLISSHLPIELVKFKFEIEPFTQFLIQFFAQFFTLFLIQFLKFQYEAFQVQYFRYLLEQPYQPFFQIQQLSQKWQ